MKSRQATTVFHFHMHLIPRYEGDQLVLVEDGELTEADKEEILNKIK